MAIGGNKREGNSNSQQDYSKKVGLFEAKVIAINPTLEEYNDKLEIELKEDSKATQYLGTNNDGNITLRVDFWLQEVKNLDKFKVSFFLENKLKVNKDSTKKQYINNIGTTSWASDINDLPEWFASRDHRVAFVGEEELYNFVRTWLGNLDYRDASTVLQIDWKLFMKGNVRDLKDQIDGEYATNVVALATIKTVEKEGEIKEYQNVYNKAFLPAYALKQFRLIDYSKPDVQNNLRTKKNKDLKVHERFVVNVTGEYGCRDFYTFKDLRDYNAEDNVVASDSVISSEGSDY
jgi:hypothetical protein